ncbi:histone H1 [Fodinibius sp.]|uniref:histone H1 n=1 Tax=Fodinibius sp. TaxID=1872440 RepID=UPI002ACDA844|nr:histone H1 [Fodinibius sp.]MDZ7660046.1 histone H1 [Fodinibius sp.]
MDESTVSLFNQMKEEWEKLEENHEDFDQKDNKAAGRRARKAANNLKKLLTPYKKASVDEAKEM